MELPVQLHFAGYETCQPKHSYGPAVRSQYLLHYILSGKGFYRRGDREYLLEKGTVFLIFPEELTYYEADEKEPWEYCWIGFDGSGVRELLRLCGLLETPVRKTAGHHAADTIRTINRVYTENGGNQVLYTGLMYQFFSCLMEMPENERPATTKSYWLTAAEHIRKNYMYDITVAGVASFIGVDRSYLYRLFQTYQGQSPQQFLRQCRVDGAKRMLLETSYSVTEVAFSCGFKDVATFGRAFRRLVGVKPTDFRKNAGKTACEN